MKGGELRSENSTLSFDLKGEKSGDGKLLVRLDLGRPGDPPGLAVVVRGAAADQKVRIVVSAEGDPRRLGSFWPSTLPALARITAAGDLALSPTPELEITATLTATPADGVNPITTRLAARYRPIARRVDLPLLALQWGPALRLDLTGSAEELDTAPRLMVKVAGTVDGSRVTGDATYAGASGGFQAKFDLRPFAAGPLLERFGYARPAFEVKAGSAGLTLEGNAEGKDRVRIQGALGLEGVEAPPWTTGARLRVNLRFGGALSRRDGGIALAALDQGEVALAAPTAEIGRLTVRPHARSGGTKGFGPLAVEAGKIGRASCRERV